MNILRRVIAYLSYGSIIAIGIGLTVLPFTDPTLTRTQLVLTYGHYYAAGIVLMAVLLIIAENVKPK